ncbi:MAG: thrombospondin type 3 repeat-containing protein [Myxococcales bacterium]|nr:thrombospondin type 3 repeat-containing protein [Myxococcales bacterium]
MAGTLGWAVMTWMLAFWSVVGCAPDADDDGLKRFRERRLGSDPRLPDTDGDLLLDVDEAILGSDPTKRDTDGDGLVDSDELRAATDPTNPDTDGDGYTDAVELRLGSDPTNRQDRAYTGGWPLASSDVAVDPSAPVRWQLRDQHGDLVDLYGFANTESHVVVSTVTPFDCPDRCDELGQWLAGESVEGIGSGYDCVRGAIAEGRLHWIVVVAAANVGRDGEVDAGWWAARYPNVRVPVVADPGLAQWTDTGIVFRSDALPMLQVLEPGLGLLDQRLAINAFVNSLQQLKELGGGPCAQP